MALAVVFELQASLVFDFQPRDPEDVLAAFSVLSRSKIPGNELSAADPSLFLGHEQMEGELEIQLCADADFIHLCNDAQEWF